MKNYHEPVLLNESVDALITNPNGVYVDCTFGGGGHSKKILKALEKNGKLWGVDQDEDAQQNIIPDQRFSFIPSNFRHIKNQLLFHQIHQVDGVLADLGVSSHQFDTAERGFSTRYSSQLDMRMNQNQKNTAKIVINEYTEEKLAEILMNYGEIRSAKKWAREIVSYRSKNLIGTTDDLKNALKSLIPAHKANKLWAQLFQALRIEVNDELKALEEFLLSTASFIKPGGRLVVISYHSLEDRLVKNFIKKGMFDGEPERDLYGRWYAPFYPLNSKVIIPNEVEIAGNPRARSAKLRIGIKNEPKEEEK